MRRLKKEEEHEAIYNSEIKEMYMVTDSETVDEKIIIDFKDNSSSIIISAKVRSDGSIEMDSDFLHQANPEADEKPEQPKKRRRPW